MDGLSALAYCLFVPEEVAPVCPFPSHKNSKVHDEDENNGEGRPALLVS